MKLVAVLLVFLFAAAGCATTATTATTANYEKILNSWTGSSELDLVRKWGPPQRVYEVGGRKFLEYADERSIFIPGTAPTYRTSVVGNTAYTNRVGGSPSRSVDMSCRTTFELMNEKVQSWRYEGNACKATE
jgi:hypothetical protein